MQSYMAIYYYAGMTEIYLFYCRCNITKRAECNWEIGDAKSSHKGKHNRRIELAGKMPSLWSGFKRRQYYDL